jgi:hypothetical protein
VDKLERNGPRIRVQLWSRQVNAYTGHEQAARLGPEHDWQPLAPNGQPSPAFSLTFPLRFFFAGQTFPPALLVSHPQIDYDTLFTLPAKEVRVWLDILQAVAEVK